jgi:hypothetical protein
MKKLLQFATDEASKRLIYIQLEKMVKMLTKDKKNTDQKFMEL